MSQTLDAIVRNQAGVSPRSIAISLDLAVIQPGGFVLGAQTVARSPFAHHVRHRWETFAASCTAIIRDGFVCRAMEFENGDLLPARLALNGHCVGIAFVLVLLLVVCSRDGSIGRYASRGLLVACEIVGKPSTVGLACSIHPRRVHAVPALHIVQQIQSERDIIDVFGRGIALPLFLLVVSLAPVPPPHFKTGIRLLRVEEDHLHQYLVGKWQSHSDSTPHC